MANLEALKRHFEEAGFPMKSDVEAAIQRLLQETDEHARESVRQNIGGPFGARFIIITPFGVYPVGDNVGNAVLSSGVASRHAEHQNWELNLPDLEEKLGQLKGVPKILLELSSAESCINCDAKHQAGVAHLRQKGLLEPNDKVLVVFGATYRQTADVAGFNDLVYLLALQRILKFNRLDAGEHNEITEKDLQISEELARRFSHTEQDVGDIPPEVAEIFRQSDKAVAVVVKDGKVFSVGNDERDIHFSRTPEVVALQNACLRQRNELGITESWDLGDAQVYTSTPEIGPMMLAEGYWSNAVKFVTVRHPRQREWTTREYPNATNTEMLRVIATRPYGGRPASPAHNSTTANLAQIFWRDKPDAVNYDGAKAGADATPAF